MAEISSVLIVNYEYPPLGGGGGVFTRDLAEELANDMRVTVLTSRAAGLPSHQRQNGVDIVRVPVLIRRSAATASLPSLLSFFPSSLWHGRRLLRSAQFDLVHSIFAVPSATSGLLLARHAGVPHVLSIIGGDIYDPSKRLSPHRTPLLYRTVKRAMTSSDHVVAISSDIRSRAIKLYGLNRRVELIPLAARRPLFRRQDRAALGFAHDDILLVTIGRLVARKGVDQLLDVFSSISDRHVKLAIIGDGPLKARLQSRARSLGVADRVRFLGAIDDEEKWRVLDVADIYTSTALHEGFGIVFLEAMESGLPIVCYNEGGQTDFLEDGGSAFLAQLDDQASFAHHVLRLCKDVQLRQRMGAYGKEVARSYRIDICARRYMKVYAGAGSDTAARAPAPALNDASLR